MKAKRLLVSGELLIDIFRGTSETECVANPLPDDARIVGCHWDEWRERVELLVVSEMYPELPEGGEPPIMEHPVYRQVNVHEK